MSWFTNKILLITGSSSGIGAAAAKHFVKLGASVIVTGRNASNLDRVATECRRLNDDRTLAIVGDLTLPSDAERVISKTLERFERLDVLVNNAGILELGSVADTTLERFDRAWNVNVRAVFYMTQLAVPHLIKTKGTVVNVSSISGLRAFPGVLPYCVSKAAVDQMTRVAALELAAAGVRVNAVNPGVILTDIHRKAGMSDDEYAAFLERAKDAHAMGRPGSVNEVVSAIEYLADGQKSSFVTGITLSVDGGKHAMCPR